MCVGTFLPISLASAMGEGIKESFNMIYTKEDGHESSDESEISISSSTSDVIDDPTSSYSSSSSSPSSSSSGSYNSQADSNSSLYQQPSLMPQPPIARGLSKFYQGKSESFTSLSDVTCIEDLAKKENPYKRKMKACKSYAGGLDLDGTVDSFCFAPAKKSSRNSFDSLANNRRCSSMSCFSNKLPPIPLKKS